MMNTFPIKNNVAQYVLEIPSTKEKVSFRPFLVGEHKNLMLSLATEDIDNIVNAIRNIIHVCSYGKVDPKKLAPFDIEYLFLQLRAKSIGESVPLTTSCFNCNEQFNFSIDVSEATVDFSYAQNNKILLTEDIGILMKYPSLEETLIINSKDTVSEDEIYDLVCNCIVSIWNSEEFVNTTDYPKEKIVDFLNTLTVAQMNKLTDFVLLVPAVRIIKEVSCPHCKENNRILIEGIENFFA